jgi:hypothetical protein
MTEAEWLACTDPTAMLEFLRGKASERKLRLWRCGWGYEVLPDMLDECSRKAVATAERYADGLADQVELLADFRAAQEAWKTIEVVRGGRHGKWIRVGSNLNEAKEAAEAARNAADPMPLTNRRFHFSWRMSAKRQYTLACFLRDIFGPLPFRPVAVDPSWRTSTVLALANGVYQDKAFDRLPILADALEEAGCDSADVLEHLRGDGPHVRGCWVVDLLLGKE